MSMHEKTFVQPACASQMSSVHEFSSSQAELSGAFEHESVASLHVSTVQPTPSPH